MKKNSVKYYIFFIASILIFIFWILLVVKSKYFLIGNVVFDSKIIMEFSLILIQIVSLVDKKYKNKIFAFVTITVFSLCMIFDVFFAFDDVIARKKIKLPDENTILMIEDDWSVEFYNAGLITAEKFDTAVYKAGFENNNLLNENKYTYQYNQNTKTVSFMFEKGDWTVEDLPLSDYNGFSEYKIIFE